MESVLGDSPDVVIEGDLGFDSRAEQIAVEPTEEEYIRVFITWHGQRVSIITM